MRRNKSAPAGDVRRLTLESGVLQGNILGITRKDTLVLLAISVPVLLLHGLGATKASFLPTLRALARRYRVIAPDLLGHGDTAKPVVFCGAMRTVSEPGWDGPANLMAAVRTAVHSASSGRGVLVTVGEQIHAAAEATKWHTQSLVAFRSAHGPLGVINRGQPVYHRPRFRAGVLPARRLVSEVDLHTMAAGVDDALVRASLARGVRGLVLQATGCGNVPPPVLPALRAALAARVPVVLVSRCAEGRVAPAYGYEGGGQQQRGDREVPGMLGVVLEPRAVGEMVAAQHGLELVQLLDHGQGDGDVMLLEATRGLWVGDEHVGVEHVGASHHRNGT